MDLSVGPIRIEVIEGLKRLRLAVEPNPHGVAADLTWNGAVPAHLEPPHRHRQFERLIFDTQVGYGLFEYFIFGPNRRFGFEGFEDVAG